ncbi:hypothetical protein CHUAL_005407 [Chamberlinius hualienensis]
MPAERPTLKSNENRRSNKPIMEKRRRARINSCLNELKTLILEALKKDPARHSKLEKADILEMTVKHLQNLQRQQTAFSAVNSPNVSNKFQAGYNECANEVSRYIRQINGVDPQAQQRLLSHLSNCIEFINRNPTSQPLNVRVNTLIETQIGQLTPQTPNSTEKTSPSSTPIGFHLVPARIVNGEFALVLPPPSTLPSCTVIRNQSDHNGGNLLNQRSNLLTYATPVPMVPPTFPEENLKINDLEPMDLCSVSHTSRVMTLKKPWRPW